MLIYDVDVCYGNLICRAVEGECDEDNGERCVVTLSNETNAHLATCDSFSTADVAIGETTFTSVANSNCPLSDEIKGWPFIKNISLENSNFNYSSGLYDVNLIVDSCGFVSASEPIDCYKIKWYINNHLVWIHSFNSLSSLPEGIENLGDDGYCSYLSGLKNPQHLRFTLSYQLAPGNYEIRAYGQIIQLKYVVSQERQEK